MTGQGLLNDFLKLTDRNSDDTDYRTLSLIWLDLVLKDIQNQQQTFQWRFLELTDTFSTAADDFDYVLSTIAPNIDTSKVIHVYDKTNDRTYRFVPYETFRRFIADETNNTGDARIFSIYSEDLLLWPVPDSIVTTSIDYVRVLIDAADNAVALLVPDTYKRVIVDGMLEWAYQFDTELGNEKNANARYKDGISRMIKDNALPIAEITQPISHRVRHGVRSHVDGRNSVFFPLAGDNV